MAEAEAITQTVSQLVAHVQELTQKVDQLTSQQTQQTAATTTSSDVRQEEIGTGERYRTVNSDNNSILFANAKLHLDNHAAFLHQLNQQAAASIETERNYLQRMRDEHAQAMARINARQDNCLSGGAKAS